MNSKLLYFLLSIVVIASGCAADKSSNPTPALAPSGTFSGEFSLIHTSQKTGKRDTSTALLQLILNTTTGYAVTGDTSKIHAGSYGSYAYNSNYISFTDKTYPATGTPTKTHLAGTYQYYYDGTVFQMLGTSAPDTLIYEYDMKKTN